MTTITNTTTTVTNTVADTITNYGNEWLVATMGFNSDSITLEYATRSHRYQAPLSTAIRYFEASLQEETFASLTCKVYGWLSSASALESARALTKDSEAYLIDLQGDKSIKQQFIAWRETLRQGKPFSSKVRETR